MDFLRRLLFELKYNCVWMWNHKISTVITWLIYFLFYYQPGIFIYIYLCFVTHFFVPILNNEQASNVGRLLQPLVLHMVQKNSSYLAACWSLSVVLSFPVQSCLVLCKKFSFEVGTYFLLYFINLDILEKYRIQKVLLSVN